MQNPVRLVDPTGMGPEKVLDRYKLLDDGQVEYNDDKGGDNVDYLMDADGNEIKLTDTSILPQLESQTMQESAYYDKDKMLAGNYAISENNSETKKLFEWIASREIPMNALISTLKRMKGIFLLLIHYTQMTKHRRQDVQKVLGILKH